MKANKIDNEPENFLLMSEEIFKLADLALEIMMSNPLKGCSRIELSEALGCSEEEANRVLAILRSRGYVEFPENRPPVDIGNKLFINSKGGDFRLSGGFAEQIRREKLTADFTEESINMIRTQKKIAYSTLYVAILTFAVLAFQVVYVVFCSNPPKTYITKPADKSETVKNAVDSLPGERTFAP
jgi:hypothetical protein